MKIAAIETSCDETAVAVIEARLDSSARQADGEHVTVLSSVVSSQVALHAQFGGVVPALAAREHTANIGPVFESALKGAGITDIATQLDAFAVTRGPGLGPALLVGLTFARTLAWKFNKPLIGVNHMDGHIHSNWLEPEQPLADIFPALNLLVSGGHTELVLMRDHTDYEILGETLDDAVGEAYDKVARLLGLGYPGGPAIDKLSRTGNAKAYPLPRPMLKSGTFDFSYSGLKTAVLYLLRELTDTDHETPLDRLAELLTDTQRADVAASFQDAAVDVLVKKTIGAAVQYGARALLLSGGVSASSQLRERLSTAASELHLPFWKPKLIYTGDNAAMIAAAGYFAYKKKKTDSSWKSVEMDANLRLGT